MRLRQTEGNAFYAQVNLDLFDPARLVALAAGVIALAWPAPTAFVLVIVVAAWALVGGFAEIAAGFGGGESAGTLALLFGLYSMIYGFSQITAGVQARQLGKSVQSLSPLHKAA